MQNNWKNIIFWSCLVVIIAVIAVVIVRMVNKGSGVNWAQNQMTNNSGANSNGNSAGQNQQAADQHPANQVLADQGKIISGFPDSLVLNLSGKVNQSYSMSGDNYKQYTVQFGTAQTPANEAKAYTDYLSAHGYKILNQNQATGNKAYSIFAEKKNSDGSIADVNVLASAPAGKDTQTQVTVTYLTK